MSDKDVKIPEDLHEIIEKSIQQGLIQRKQRCRRNKTIGLSAAAGCCAFLFFFNTNTVFAKTVLDLPLVSQIAHLSWTLNPQAKKRLILRRSRSRNWKTTIRHNL